MAEAERKSASRDAAEKEATSLRQELGLKQAEIVRLEDAVAKAGEELKALLAATGSEREKVLGNQLTEAKDKVLEVEKVAAGSDAALHEAQKLRGEAEAECERLRSRAEAAEGDLASVREELSAKASEIVRLEGDLAKQSEDMKAVLSASGNDRERVLGEQLASATSKAQELEKALAASETAVKAENRFRFHEQKFSSYY